MKDTIFESFLEENHREAIALAAESDLLELHPLDPAPSRHWVAEFRCRGLVETPQGVEQTDRFRLGFSFPRHYLRRVEAPEVVRLLGPIETFHPNILFPLVCPGRVLPTMTLADLLFQCHEILTYQKVTMREDDALNPKACAWARDHVADFPIDRRPLRRRTLALKVREVSA